MRDRIISITESEYIYLKELEDDYKYIAEDYKNLKQRINKAIGHINACDCILSTDETRYLLEILKGDSNE